MQKTFTTFHLKFSRNSISVPGLSRNLYIEANNRLGCINENCKYIILIFFLKTVYELWTALIVAILGCEYCRFFNWDPFHLHISLGGQDSKPASQPDKLHSFISFYCKIYILIYIQIYMYTE